MAFCPVVWLPGHRHMLSPWWPLLAIEFPPGDYEAAVALEIFFYSSFHHPWTIFLNPSYHNVVFCNLFAVSLVGYSVKYQAPFCPDSPSVDRHHQPAGLSPIWSLGLPSNHPLLLIVQLKLHDLPVLRSDLCQLVVVVCCCLCVPALCSPKQVGLSFALSGLTALPQGPGPSGASSPAVLSCSDPTGVSDCFVFRSHGSSSFWAGSHVGSVEVGFSSLFTSSVSGLIDSYVSVSIISFVSSWIHVWSLTRSDSTHLHKITINCH